MSNTKISLDDKNSGLKRGEPMTLEQAIAHVDAQVSAALDDGKPQLFEMIDLCERSARRARNSAEDHARSGYPIANEFVRQHVVFDAIARLLKKIESKDKEVAAILRG